MSISALDSYTTVVNTDTSSSSDSTDDTSDVEEQKIEFLELLLTQLENQNPLDPMDTTEWTAQLVAYSQLEQQMETNEYLDSAISLLNTTASTYSLSYIGEEVEVDTNINVVSENLDATWSYSIEETAEEVTLAVYDSDGNTIWTEDGETSSGLHTFTLDLSDLDVEEGDVLYLSVTAEDSEGEELDSEISATVTVDGSLTEDETVYLTAGGMSFTLEDVLKIVTTSDA